MKPPAPHHHRRIALGVGANAMGKVWVAVSQLLSVPVLIHAWGVGGYGLWLMVSAVPTYIMLSDFGFGTAAAVDLASAHAADDPNRFNTTLQSVWILVCAISAIILAVTAALWIGRDDLYLIFPDAVGSDVVLASAAVLILAALLNMQLTVLLSAYKATGHFALGVMAVDLVHPVSLVGVIIVSISGGGILAAALATLAPRILAFPLYYLFLKSRVPYVQLGFSRFSTEALNRLVRPSLATLGLQVGQALAIQGVVITVGLTMGPAMAGVFGVAKTLVRMPLQLVAIITRAISPEVTLAHVNSERVRVQRLVALSFAISGCLAIGAAAGATIFGPWAMRVLSGGQTTAPMLLFLGLSIAMAAESLWSTGIQNLIATNAHDRIAPYYIAIAGLSAASPLLAPNLIGVAFMSVGLESLMLAITAYTSWKILRPDFSVLLPMVKSLRTLASRVSTADRRGD